MMKLSNILIILVVCALPGTWVNLFSQPTVFDSEAILFHILGDSLVISFDGNLQKSLPFQPKQVFGPEDYQEDRVFKLANTVVVQRGVHVKGAFCHFPDVMQVDIITGNGSLLTIPGNQPSKFTSGITLSQAFNGNQYHHSNGKLGLISSTAEGQLYGFLLINEQGQVFEIPMEKHLLSDFYIFFEKEKFVLSLIDGHNPQKHYELIIYDCGTYEFLQ